MKPKFLLGGSLILNVVALALLWFANHRPPPAPVTIASTPDAAPRPDLTSTHPRAESVKISSAPMDWIQAMRNAGVPENVIADVAVADFQARWQKRSLENQKKFDAGELDQDAIAKFDLEHDVEQEKELRAALGDEGFRQWDKTKVLAEFDRAGLPLSGSESDALYQLRKDLDQKRLALEKAQQSGTNAEDAGAQLEALTAQYNKQLLNLLGDDRYAQLQSGGDTGLGELRRDLRAMNADDTQVAGLETAQQTWNSARSKLEIQLQKGEVTSEDFEKQMKALDADRDQQYQKVLGPDGFAELQKNQDERYQTMKRVGASSGFTDNDINNLYATIQGYEANIRDYQERAEAVEAQGQPVDWPAVEKALKDYSQQTENALRVQLGDKFDKLKRSNVMPFER